MPASDRESRAGHLTKFMTVALRLPLLLLANDPCTSSGWWNEAHPALRGMGTGWASACCCSGVSVCFMASMSPASPVIGSTPGVEKEEEEEEEEEEDHVWLPGMYCWGSVLDATGKGGQRR